MKELPIIYPMGAKKVKADKLKKLWGNPNYIAEIKYDGYRYLCHITEEGNYFTSRSKSVQTGRPVEKSDRIPHLRDFKFKDLEGTILDGEIIAPTMRWDDTNSIMGSLPERAIKIQEEIGDALYIVFDILYYKGTDVTSYPYEARRGILEEIFYNQGLMHKISKNRYGYSTDFHLSETFEPSEELFHYVVKQGMEGLILKHLDKPYTKSSEKMKKPSNTWIKVKKYDTYDVVILGFEEPEYYYEGKYPDTWQYKDKDGNLITKHAYYNWIGSIKYGVYDENEELIELGSLTGINEEDRAWITKHKDELVGRVMEVGAMEVEKSGALRHPRFLRIRDIADKNPKECTIVSIKNKKNRRKK